MDSMAERERFELSVLVCVFQTTLYERLPKLTDECILWLGANWVSATLLESSDVSNAQPMEPGPLVRIPV